MWEELYEKHYKELLRYAVAACKNLAEAEDAAQEVFLKALQNPDTFADLGPSQKRAWLFRTLKNLMCDRYRRGQLENAYLEARQEQAEYWDPGIQETENRLLLAQLTPEDRTLFHLRYEEGYSASELSEMFHIPAGTNVQGDVSVTEAWKGLLLEKAAQRSCWTPRSSTPGTMCCNPNKREPALPLVV